MNLFMIYLKKNILYIKNMAPMIAEEGLAFAASNPDLTKTAVKGWLGWMALVWCICPSLLLSCCAYLCHKHGS